MQDNKLYNIYNKSFCGSPSASDVVLYEGIIDDLYCNRFFTASLMVEVQEEIIGYKNSDSLFLIIEIFDDNGLCKTAVSSSAPNVVGSWELSTQAVISYMEHFIRIKFVYNIGSAKDLIKLSDIRITKTDGKIEAFMLTAKRPFKDFILDGNQIRDYSVSCIKKDIELVDYLNLAKEKGYRYDLKRVGEYLCSQNKKYSFFYKLFVENDCKIFKQKNVISFIQGLDENVSDKIHEKLVLLGEYEILKWLKENKSSLSPYVRLINKHLGIEEISSKDISKLSLEEEKKIPSFVKGSLIHFCYAGCEDFPLNRWMISWFERNYSEIKRRAKLLTKEELLDSSESPIFVFWSQGVEAAPPIVQKCIGQMRDLFGNRLHVLDSNNIKYYARMENCDKVSSITALADYLRAELLMRYGGIWIDATVFVKRDFFDIINEYTDIVPTYMPAYKHLGNWLLAIGRRYSYFYCLLYSALNMFLYDYKDFITYYMFHRFWEIICFLDKEAAAYWEKAYKLSARNALEMWLGKSNSLTEDRSDKEFEAFYNLSPVHKLTYKYDEYKAGFFSNISRIMRIGTNKRVSKTTGEIDLNDRSYYFDEITGKPVTGLKIVNSFDSKKLCLFDDNGWLKGTSCENYEDFIKALLS